MHGRKTNPSEPASTWPASRDRKSYASPSPTDSASRSIGANWSRHHRRLPPETNPGFSSSQTSGSAWGWHSTSIVGSSRGSALAAHTGSAVPTTSQTSPGANTPAPRVAAISSPHPTATTVEGSSPVASANAGVIPATAAVPSTTGGNRSGSTSTASRTSLDHSRVRGSSKARDEAFE